MTLGAEVMREYGVMVGVAECDEVGIGVYCVGAWIVVLHNISLVGTNRQSV